VIRPVLIVRAEPGAGQSAARARALGLTPVTAPLFTVRPLPWQPPPAGGFDAVMLTSAQAARHGGGGLTPFLALPCYTVGEATAAAALEAGFGDVRPGPADGAALLAKMAAEGIGAAFHPCGRDRIELAHPRVRIGRVAVYAAEEAAELPLAAAAALREGALALLHSPRSAALFARLAGDRRGEVALAAISAATAAAAGPGWRACAVAPVPRDEALLELAAKLCQTAGDER